MTIKIAIPGRPSLRRTSSSVGVDQHKEWTDESVAMDITSHKTASVFERYNITSRKDKIDALRRRQIYVDRQDSRSNVLSMRAGQNETERSG